MTNEIKEKLILYEMKETPFYTGVKWADKDGIYNVDETPIDWKKNLGEKSNANVVF